MPLLPRTQRPFVKVGDTVKKGQVLGIVEAMKLMNEIESEYDGVVEAILVKNEEVVEYGQPLFRIRELVDRGGLSCVEMEETGMLMGIKEIEEIHSPPTSVPAGGLLSRSWSRAYGAVGYKCVTYNEPFFAGPFSPGAGDAGRPDRGGPGPDRRCGDLQPGGKQGKDRIFRRHQQLPSLRERWFPATSCVWNARSSSRKAR